MEVAVLEIIGLFLAAIDFFNLTPKLELGLRWLVLQAANVSAVFAGVADRSAAGEPVIDNLATWILRVGYLIPAICFAAVELYGYFTNSPRKVLSDRLAWGSR